MKVLVCFLALVAGAFGTTYKVQSGINGRIYGGQDAFRSEYPYAVSLQYCVRDECQHACGGAIISPSWIVTAAHCFTDVPGQGSFRVIAGVTNLDDPSTDRQLIRVSHAFVPPTYAGGAGPNDIAIFKLVSRLTFNEAVQPIRVITSGYPATGSGTIVGWGAIGGSVTPIMPNTLQTVSVPILSFDECQTVLDSLLSTHPLDQSNTCTGPLTGSVSSCTGDSGDPLVIDNVLQGVVSWGVTPCGTANAPAFISANLYPHRTWIVNHLDEPLLQ